MDLTGEEKSYPPHPFQKSYFATSMREKLRCQNGGKRISLKKKSVKVG
jgi:hypothetical protein